MKLYRFPIQFGFYKNIFFFFHSVSVWLVVVVVVDIATAADAATSILFVCECVHEERIIYILIVYVCTLHNNCVYCMTVSSCFVAYIRSGSSAQTYPAPAQSCNRRSTMRQCATSILLHTTLQNNVVFSILFLPTYKTVFFSPSYYCCLFVHWAYYTQCCAVLCCFCVSVGWLDCRSV